MQCGTTEIDAAVAALLQHGRDDPDARREDLDEIRDRVEPAVRSQASRRLMKYDKKTAREARDQCASAFFVEFMRVDGHLTEMDWRPAPGFGIVDPASSKQPEKLRPCLLRAVEREARDPLTAEGCVPLHESHLPPSIEADPVTEAADVERKERLMAALEACPMVFREAVVLHYVRGLTIGETGEVLGLPKTTAHRRLKEGKQWLAQYLGEES